MKRILMTLMTLMTLMIVSVNTFAYTPTLESLLRNGNNIDISNNTVVANLTISEIDPQNNLPFKVSSELANKQVLKLIVVNEKEDAPTLTQVNYKGGVISNNTIVGYSEKSFKALTTFMPNNENPDAEIFYATLSMLLNNHGDMLIEVLRKHNANIQTNTILVDKEKLKLLSSYKRYLVNMKDVGKDSVVEFENPLKPLEEEKQEKVSQINKKAFLSLDPLVKKQKIDDEFFWVVENQNIYLKFDNEHRFKEMTLKLENGDVEIILGKFVIHGNQIEFPEFFWIKDQSGRKFEIKAQRLIMFSDNRDQHNKRLKKYRESAEKNKITEPLVKPSFVL